MTAELETLEPRWNGPVIIAATGEGLTKEVAAACIASGRPIIAIKQAVLRLPNADVLYACDAWLWEHYKGFPAFKGERWSTHSSKNYDNKLEAAEKYCLRLVRGQAGQTFSTDPSIIAYGNSAGFQAIGMAIHWMRRPGTIILVGFNMSGGYFYGTHPRGRQVHQFHAYIPHFEKASKALPEGVEIVNSTPGSLLGCFPKKPLEVALAA